MNRITAIVVDDEAFARRILIQDIEDHCDHIEVIAEAENAKEARKMIQRLSPDIVFLDVQMPNESGLTMLEFMENRDFLPVIYSSYQEFAFEAIKLRVADYLLKPLDPQALRASMGRVYDDHLKREELLGDTQRIEFYTSGKRHFIRSRDILYMKASGSYSEIYLKNNERLLMSRNLKFVHEMIEDDGFIRVHNSYVVNQSYITGLDVKSNTCRLVNDEEVPYSSRKKVLLQNQLRKGSIVSVQPESCTVHKKGRA